MLSKLLLTLVIPSFLIGATIVLVAHGAVYQSFSAEPIPGVDAINCDDANLGANDQGHIRGNSHCSTGVEPKEPPRDCDSPNAEKDNDDDGATICIGRG